MITSRTKLRVGLLGGTFNPAHEGHRFISIEAIKRLKLNFVIWLVTPQNPLKDLDVLGNLDERVAYAKKIASHPKIKVSDWEKRLHTNYTYETLCRLRTIHPNTEFVWLMGADNLVNFHKWSNWQKILEICPLAIFERAGFSKYVLYSKLAMRYKCGNIGKTYTGNLKLGNWYYLKTKKLSVSSTIIRGH